MRRLLVLVLAVSPVVAACDRGAVPLSLRQKPPPVAAPVAAATDCAR